MIPKLDDYQRELGIPTVTDRLIQPALLKVLQLLIDPTLSEHGHGFRPGRPAHDAVKAAGAYVGSCKRLVVDADLAKFFQPGQPRTWAARRLAGEAHLGLA